MNYVLKYTSGEFVGIDNASGGCPYPTENFSSARMFDNKLEAKMFLSRLLGQFPTEKFNINIFEVSFSPIF
jgi:hypothetical protein